MTLVNFNKYLFIFLSINICLIPVFLITGPFLSDLSLSLCSILYLFYILLNKKFNVFKNYFFIFFLIFYLTILISSLQSANIFFSLHSSLPYIRFGLFILCVWHTAKEDIKLFNKIFLVLTAIYILLVFDGYLQFFTGTNILNFEKTGIRISSFFGDELILGSYVIRFLPIYLGLYFYTIVKRYISIYEKIFFLIFFILISILVIISGERTAFALLLISIFLILFSLKGFKKARISFLLIFVLTSIIFTFVYQNNFQRLFVETKQQIIKENKIYFFGQRRHEYANVSINIFKDNIFLGSGPRTYRVESKNDKYAISDLSWNTHPHSMYLQLLAETGIMGTLLIIFVFCYFIIQIFNQSKNKNFSNLKFNIQSCVVIAIIINFFPLMPSGNFFNNWISIVYYYPVAIFFGLKYETEKI